MTQKQKDIQKAQSVWGKSYMFRITDAAVGRQLGDWLITWTDEGLPVRDIQDRLKAEGCVVGLATVWRWVAPLDRG